MQADRISQSDFYNWKQNPVTQAYFKAIQRSRDQMNIDLTDSNVLLGPGAETRIPLIVGERNGLDYLLQIEVEELNIQEEINDESQEALRAQNIS